MVQWHNARAWIGRERGEDRPAAKDSKAVMNTITSVIPQLRLPKRLATLSRRTIEE